MMFLGIDCSTQLEVDEKNPHYFHNGKPVDPWKCFKDENNVSWMRLRVWLDPYDEKGRPYGGGTNDYPAFVKLAKRALSLGYKILLDFHYSDFWADPGKQMIPKSWRGLNIDQLAEKVYEYTKQTLTKAKEDGIHVSAVQIGNEITNGTLWPEAKLLDPDGEGVRKGYDNLAKILKAGCKAAHEFDPELIRIIHLERSGSKKIHQEYFEEIIKRGVEFEVIGESFYPYWHGTYEMVFDNFDNLKALFHKPVWIVETGYGFTMEPYVLNQNNGVNLIDEEFFKQKDTFMIFPLTKQGQKDFIEGLLSRCKEHGIEGIFYWEPCWLPLPGLTWATVEGETYINETNKPTNNEWANQCLFDYEGNATPAFDSFKV